MGVWQNIKDNIRDIAGGAKDVATGTPTSPYLREKRRNEAKFEEVSKNPVKNTSGYYTDREISRMGGGSSGGSSGGGSSGGSSSASNQAQLEAQVKAQAEAKAKAEAEAKRITEEIKRNQQEALRLKREQSSKVSDIRQVITGNSGYEVLRDGQGYSTRTPRKDDIIIRKVGGSSNKNIKTDTSQVKDILPGGDLRLNKNEIYDQRTGMYISPSEASGQATGYMRPPTPEEAKAIKEANIKGNAILGAIPVLSQAKFFNYQLTPEQEKDIYGGSTTSTVLKFLNPKYQYDLAKSQEELRQDALSFKDSEKRINKARADLIKSGLNESELQNLGNRELTSEQIKAINKYNVVVNYVQSTPEYKNLIRDRRTSFDIIATSDSKPLKVTTSAVIRTGQTLPYFTPAGRALFGADIAFEGGKALEVAETKTEKYVAGGQIALGGLLAYSGVRGIVGGGSSGASVTGTQNQLNLFKGATYASGISLGVSLGALDYTSQLVQTGDKSVALGSALGTGGTIIGGMLAPKVYEKVSDYLRVRGLERLETPPLEAKPFIRGTRGGTNQAVYYERARKFSLFNPKTYKYRGYKEGQFFKRQYRIIDPLVEAKIQGKTELSYFTIKDGKVVKVTDKTTSFPYDNPKTNLDWFGQTKDNVQQYYIPKKYAGNVGSYEGFGYSATPSKFIETPELDAYQKYFSGKGVSAYFFREGGAESGSVQVGGSVNVKGKPVLYSAYFEKVKVNPAKTEITVPNPMGGDKGWKQYVLTSNTEAGTLNLPVFKQEVEGVVSGTRTSLGSGYFFKFSGRNIPIEEGVYSIGGMTGNVVSGSSSSGSSYIPSESYVPNPFKVSILPSVSASSYTPETSSIISPSASSQNNILSSSVQPSSQVYSFSSSKPKSSRSSISQSSSPISISRISSSISQSSSPSLKKSSVSSYFSKRETSSIIRPQTPTSYKSYPPVKPSEFFKSKAKPTKQTKKGDGEFEVFVKKGGEDIEIGKSETLEGAKLKLTSELEGTLRASGFIKESGKKLTFGEVGIKSSSFRVSKKDPFRIVEKKTRRIKRGTQEVPEILKSRGKKKSKSRFF